MPISVLFVFGSRILRTFHPAISLDAAGTVQCFLTEMGFGLRLNKELRMRQIKFIVEKHADGYVAYPLGIRGVVVGEGETYDDALADAQSALKFHVETFGLSEFDDASILEAFVTEAGIDA